MTAGDSDAAEDSKPMLTDYELNKLKTAYNKTLLQSTVENYTQE